MEEQIKTLQQNIVKKAGEEAAYYRGAVEALQLLLDNIKKEKEQEPASE